MICTKIYTSTSNIYYIIVFCGIILAKSSVAQPALSLTTVINSGLSAPIQFVNANDGSNRVFIVQQGGTIRAYDAAFNFLSTFLTVSGITTGGERGLLSMVFHPDYETNGFFYVYYTNTDGNLELARYHISSDANIADPASKVILITIPHPVNSNHNGGELHFGYDGYLYLSTGDGGGGGDVPNNAQNTAVLLGKILRFNVNTSNTAPYYTIPADNPYGNEIFALGLRNPFRWSFDRLTNDMWIGDVGQNSWEEINFRAAGTTNNVNYGWRCYEGNNTYNTANCGAITNYTFPVYTYATQDPSAAVTGGVVYRGTLYPSLQGYNISADFYSGTFYKTISDGAGSWNTSTQVLSSGIADFGETENGEVYVVSLTGGTVSHLISSGVVPVTLTRFNGTLNRGTITLNWQTTMEINIRQFEIEYSVNGTSFSSIGTVGAQHSPSGAAYDFSHPFSYTSPAFFRLKITNQDGTINYSDIIRLVLNNKANNLVPTTIINDGILKVSLPAMFYNSLELISLNGTVILKRNITGQSGNIKIPIDKKLPTGIYTVRLTGTATAAVEKILLQ